MPLPATSPSTTPSRPEGSTNASYQSPPTSAPRPLALELEPEGAQAGSLDLQRDLLPAPRAIHGLLAPEPVHDLTLTPHDHRRRPLDDLDLGRGRPEQRRDPYGQFRKQLLE